MNTKNTPLPLSRREMEARGWSQCDIILVTEDAYEPVKKLPAQGDCKAATVPPTPGAGYPRMRAGQATTSSFVVLAR